MQRKLLFQATTAKMSYTNSFLGQRSKQPDGPTDVNMGSRPMIDSGQHHREEKPTYQASKSGFQTDGHGDHPRSPDIIIESEFLALRTNTGDSADAVLESTVPRSPSPCDYLQPQEKWVPNTIPHDPLNIKPLHATPNADCLNASNIYKQTKDPRLEKYNFAVKAHICARKLTRILSMREQTAEEGRNKAFSISAGTNKLTAFEEVPLPNTPSLNQPTSHTNNILTTEDLKEILQIMSQHRKNTDINIPHSLIERIVNSITVSCLSTDSLSFISKSGVSKSIDPLEDDNTISEVHSPVPSQAYTPNSQCLSKEETIVQPPIKSMPPTLQKAAEKHRLISDCSLKCFACDLRAPSANILLNHMESHEYNVAGHCSICSLKLQRRNQAIRHYINCHKLKEAAPPQSAKKRLIDESQFILGPF
ncbi:hypothetical protein B566_EDAN008298 [Ephemera danica]|nr:hypothetical protein B566_EDAN008298 [Ephemera danica]